MNPKLSQKTTKLVLGGILVAMSVVLSLIKVFELPYGGSITLCSMLPVMLFSYVCGLKWGMFAGFVYSITQLLLGTGVLKGMTPLTLVGVILFDYIVAFSVLGLAGIFRGKFKNDGVSFALGCAFAGLLRLASHFISGYLFYGTYAEWYFSQDNMPIGPWVLDSMSGQVLAAFYSLIYNMSYMLPEIIITCIAAFVIIKLAGKQLLKLAPQKAAAESK